MTWIWSVGHIKGGEHIRVEHIELRAYKEWRTESIQRVESESI